MKGAKKESASSVIASVSGHGLPLRGHDIDTDRIMPARFLRAVSFDGLEKHLFEDDRKGDPKHPFDDARYRSATILIVNSNFGCGSSREHAPQGLARAGYKALVGQSFSEIFLGNSTLLGLPCFVVSREDAEALQALVERTPDVTIHADVESGAITAGTLSVKGSLPPALRDSFLTGQWNPTAMLLNKFDEVKAVGSRLPYLNGFAAV